MSMWWVSLSFYIASLIIPYKTLLLFQDGKMNVKFTLEQSTKAQRRSRFISLLFLQPQRLMELVGQSHAPIASTPGKDSVPIS